MNRRASRKRLAESLRRKRLRIQCQQIIGNRPDALAIRQRRANRYPLTAENAAWRLGYIYRREVDTVQAQIDHIARMLPDMFSQSVVSFRIPRVR